MFQVRPFETKTCTWWYSQRDEIDLNPPYQRRGNLWSDEKKAFLIDSILNGFDFPKIYIADFTYVNTPLNEKSKSYAVIDGKQRLETIFGFFKGDVKLSPNFIYFKNPNLDLKKLKFDELKSKHPRIASVFENFNVTAVSVITDDEALLNELFVRMNSSKPLSGAEIRNAMRGKVPKLIKNISKHQFYLNNIKFPIKTGQDQNSAAKLLLVEYRGKLIDTKKKNLDNLVAEHVEKDKIIDFESLSQTNENAIERTAERVIGNLNIMSAIFFEKDPLLNKQGLLTVYYWFVRNYKMEYKEHIREFILFFDSKLKQNKSKLASKLAPEENNPDDKLSYYETLSRSVNDQKSLNEMYAIIVKYFEQWLRDNTCSQ